MSSVSCHSQQFGATTAIAPVYPLAENPPACSSISRGLSFFSIRYIFRRFFIRRVCKQQYRAAVSFFSEMFFSLNQRFERAFGRVAASADTYTVKVFLDFAFFIRQYERARNVRASSSSNRISLNCTTVTERSPSVGLRAYLIRDRR